MAPLYFKHAVDALASGSSAGGAKAAIMALLWSGACRIVSGVSKELQHPVFTPVSQVLHPPPRGRTESQCDWYWNSSCKNF